MRADSSDRTGQVFQSLWLGARLSPLEHLCVKSFLAHGHRFVLYSYDQVDNVPPGTVVEDARAIIPEDDVFRHDLGNHVGQAGGFSDRFRYELLRARGGWWIDTDVLCLKSDIPETPYVFAREDDHGYNGAVLKAPPDSVFLTRALARAAEPRSGKASHAIHQALEVDLGVGPQLVTELVRELGLESEAWAREDLYAVSWDEALTFLDPAQADSIEARVASSTFVHFWNTMLRLANVHKDVRPRRRRISTARMSRTTSSSRRTRATSGQRSSRSTRSRRPTGRLTGRSSRCARSVTCGLSVSAPRHGGPGGGSRIRSLDSSRAAGRERRQGWSTHAQG